MSRSNIIANGSDRNSQGAGVTKEHNQHLPQHQARLDNLRGPRLSRPLLSNASRFRTSTVQNHLRNIDAVDPKYLTFEALTRLPIVRRARPYESTNVSRRRTTVHRKSGFHPPLSLEYIIGGAIEVIRKGTQHEQRDVSAWCVNVQGEGRKYTAGEMTHLAVNAALVELQCGDVEVVDSEKLGK